ncbi:MAG: SDR family NAD(P)-dependent oxidoreductase [Lachnospiraceae bacterium]|jgi:3-oxoacyl-[acyl-carrier protein] reductase
MKVLITGTSSGMGRGFALKFLECGHEVIGFDVKESSIDNERYEHYRIDVRCPEAFPDDIVPEIIINNAGVQNSGDDIGVNLTGAINVTEKYAIGNEKLRSVVMIGSASGHTGSEFPEYAASKGGLIAYTKNVALRIAPNAVCNSIDPGGVITELNAPVMKDEKLWNRIMELTPLKRWAEVEEIAEWVYFVAVKNRFMTGQNLLIDGGEAGKMNFIWPEE